jgi:hypothetical protein
MANFIPTSNNSWQQILGNAVGTGLATEHYSTRDILNNLAQEKALNAQARHYRTLNPNISLEQAQALVRQPPAVQQAAFGYQPQQQQQPQQLQGPQQQQMPQQMQQPQMPANALQLLQGQQQRQPSIAELEFLRRLPKPMRNQVGGGIPQEQMQPAPQQVPQQIAAQPQAPTIPQGPNLGEFIGQRLAKPGPKSQEAISKEDQQFGLDLSKRIEYGRKIEKNLDEIDSLVEKPDINWGLIASKAPISTLNTNTKKLVNKFAQVLGQQVQASSQGRGSDLLRKIIQEGKFTLEQGPEVWREVSAGLREDVEYDNELYKARHNILKEYGGKPPQELAYLTRERAAQNIQNQQTTQASTQANPKGTKIAGLPAAGSEEAKALQGRALKGPHGPVIYLDGVPYPATKKNGKWVKE